MADWKRVPVEPTEEMIWAGVDCDEDGPYRPELCRRILRAGIAAAPPDGCTDCLLEEVERSRGAEKQWEKMYLEAQQEVERLRVCKTCGQDKRIAEIGERFGYRADVMAGHVRQVESRLNRLVERLDEATEHDSAEGLWYCIQGAKAEARGE